jgi:serine/threonine protein kinase
MNQGSADDSRRDDALNEVLLSYLDALAAGRITDRALLLAEHPDLRPELERFFANYDATERLASPLRMARRESSARLSLGDPSNVKTETPFFPTREGGRGEARDAIGKLGDFHLLREVGRGGMGVIYEAEQISLRRRVALKVLPFATAMDPRQLQRFKHEALAAANLCHENIVPVYAVGVERSVHYYAMRFIDGQSLAALISEMRRMAGEFDRQAPPSSQSGQSAARSGLYAHLTAAETEAGEAANLTAASISRERSSRSRKYFHWVADVSRQAALALEHAHQMGIVHRDIKPANLLLDNSGHLWVTDFGLAQFQSHVGVTMTGELLGTLRYVSPEQALAKRGLVDHRADIYSLGATLYEMLTLKPVFDGTDRHVLLSQIRFEEPLTPRQQDPAIPVELETILLKALAKSPSERYGTALELADDLHRFMEDKPVLARRPSLFERVRKWCRRHPSTVAAAMLVLIVCLVGLTASNWMIAREQAKTQTALKSEKERAADAREAVGLLVDLSEERLADNPALEDVRLSLLETALEYYQRFLASQGPDTAVHGDLERGRERVNTILNELATLRTARLVGLVTQRAVQKDLALDDKQCDQFAQLPFSRLPKRTGKQHRVFEELTAEERRQKLYDIARRDEQILLRILNKDQLRRLQQIELQKQGPAAFHQTYPVGMLRLTDKQKRQIRQISEEAMAAIRRGPPQKTVEPNWNSDWRERVQKAEVEQVVTTVLTAEQMTRWREMVGAPIQNGRPLPGFDGRWPPPDDGTP